MNKYKTSILTNGFLEDCRGTLVVIANGTPEVPEAQEYLVIGGGTLFDAILSSQATSKSTPEN